MDHSRVDDILVSIADFKPADCSDCYTFVPDDFVMALLTIKMRILTIHHAQHTTDTNIYKTQLQQANRLLDYIDEHNPTTLRALLNLDPLLSQPEPDETLEGHPSSAYSIVQGYLEGYRDERPMFLTLTSMLVERYGTDKPEYEFAVKLE